MFIDTRNVHELDDRYLFIYRFYLIRDEKKKREIQVRNG